ncbi:hypothetical protein HU200_037499 [Digitaria exilis]|uniref:ZF-HD dimerization-type domain-containing protein n=1 Tax=Digitaria exilis TaxID=1010633 RepID=A0A835BBH8_9POAL|nr:hypothetical protein HU200_037499 [Digitaria exilis]
MSSPLSSPLCREDRRACCSLHSPLSTNLRPAAAALLLFLSPRPLFTSLPVVFLPPSRPSSSLDPSSHAKAPGLGARGNLSPVRACVSLPPVKPRWGRSRMEAMDAKYRPLMFPNGGGAKKVKPAAVSPAAAAAPGEPMYRECLKNHAASLGGHAVDGCGEFMPSPAANPADPTSLKCAACGCHRNFHRRAVEGSPPPPPPSAPLALPAPASVLLHGHPHRGGGGGGEERPEERLPGVVDDSDSDSDASEYDEERSVSPPPPHHVLPAPVAQQPPPPPPPYFAAGPPHMLLSLGSGGAPGAAAAAAAQRLAPPAHQLTPSSAPPGGAMPRKRFRTKFTAEQKQRMQELSERLGWRLQKRDEAIVDEWCRDIGVGKGVFKVWMHNNKHNFLGGHSARRSASSSSVPGAGAPQLHTPTATAGAAAPSFNDASTIAAPPPVLTSSPPASTGFNMNGAASSAPSVTAGHPDNGNGASSPQQAGIEAMKSARFAATLAPKEQGRRAQAAATRSYSS